MQHTKSVKITNLLAKSVNLQIEMENLANENKVMREKIRNNKIIEESSDEDT